LDRKQNSDGLLISADAVDLPGAAKPQPNEKADHVHEELKFCAPGPTNAA